MPEQRHLDEGEQCEWLTVRGRRCTYRQKVGKLCVGHDRKQKRTGVSSLAVRSPDSIESPNTDTSAQASAMFGGLDPSRREHGPGCIGWIAQELLSEKPRLDPQTAHVIIGGIKAVMRATDLGESKRKPVVRFETVRSRADADRVMAAIDEEAVA